MNIVQHFPSIQSVIDKYPRNPDKRFLYGTAGFRALGETLNTPVFRVGLLAVLRSYYKKQNIGVMITASHNPVADNGVKIVDADGGMLEFSWESYAVEIANADAKDVVSILNKICDAEKIVIDGPAILHIGRDTRPSGETLLKCCTEGMKCLGAYVFDFGLLTTPQLHHSVRAINLTRHYSTIQGYNEETVSAVAKLLEGYPLHARGPLYIDCANGVGANSWKLLVKPLEPYIKIILKNTGDGTLNFECGSDFVQNNKVLPHSFTSNEYDKQCLSIDGDCDRVVCYYHDSSSNKFNLLDGDKIAVLFVKWILQKLEIMKIVDKVSLSLVQTAYANGSSTNYIKTLDKVKSRIAKTGVKNLHHIAIQYDIGVYFEANGHGTVVFSENIKKILEDFISVDAEQSRACRDLKNAIKLINQAVGDAISDSLLIQCVLTQLKLSLSDWHRFYDPLINYQVVVKVEDKTIIQNNDDETRVIKPIELQNFIDKVVPKYKNGRSFVRPSGTEDAVRVYAEACSKEEAINLAKEVMQETYKLCKGVGELNYSLLK